MVEVEGALRLVVAECNNIQLHRRLLWSRCRVDVDLLDDAVEVDR